MRRLATSNGIFHLSMFFGSIGNPEMLRNKNQLSGSTLIYKNLTSLFIIALPEHGKNVTRAGSIFASIDASTKLTERLQDVHVVTAHKVLGQVHNGHHESLLHRQKKSG